MATSIRNKNFKNYKISYLLNVVSVVLIFQLVLVQGFFIDLEALGFGSTSTTNTGDEASKVLIAAPSEQEVVEVDSVSDPNKSVKLTLGELKQLILGSVKDITSKVQAPPINIKISTSPKKTTTTTTTPTPISSSSINEYKYSLSSPYSESEDFDENSSSWGESGPTISLTTDDDAYYSNEVSGQGHKKHHGVKGHDDDKGWFTSAKSVLRRPTKIMNSYKSSFNGWRNVVKPGNNKRPKPQRRRPIQDITYEPERRQRRRKKPPPPKSRRRRPRPPSRRHHNHHNSRRGQEQRMQSFYNDDEYGDDYVEEYHQPVASYANAWDRMANVGSSGSGNFDSTMPLDDIPMNMVPPKPYSPYS